MRRGISKKAKPDPRREKTRLGRDESRMGRESVNVGAREPPLQLGRVQYIGKLSLPVAHERLVWEKAWEFES